MFVCWLNLSRNPAELLLELEAFGPKKSIRSNLNTRKIYMLLKTSFKNWEFEHYVYGVSKQNTTIMAMNKLTSETSK